jgi:outer membrane protein assembly factor BamB
MYKKWITRVGLVILVTYVVLKSTLSISFTSENFPLSEKWSTRLRSSIQQISIADNQIVLVKTAAEIYALEIKSGKLLWHRATDYWLSNDVPALAQNGIVFFTDSKWIWALNQSDGEVLWQQRLHSGGADVVDVSMDMVAVFDTQQISVYRTTDGALQWRKPVCRNSDQIYLHNSKLYFPCFGMTAVAVASGETVWEEKTERGIWIAVYADGVMYSSPDNENITAYDLESRKQLWSTPLSTDGEKGFKIVDELLFVTDGTHFCVLQRYDGRKLWCADGMLNPQNPARVGDTIYIFNGPQNMITAFDIHSGTKLGQLRMTSFKVVTTFSQLMVSSDELLIFASGKEVFAFGK